ncbi:MAG: hypothetical protein EOM84_01155 [Sphingobacteriia bacterium]|nr:hypothetical protein [Sphingobacteriia bacterium]
MEQKIILNQVIKNFAENLNELRELLKLPEKFESQAKSAKKKMDEILLPIIIKRVEADLNKPPKGITKEKVKETLKNLIKEYKSIAPKNVSKDDKLLIKVDESYFKSISRKKLEKDRETFAHCLSHQIHIEKAVLFNLVSYLEQSFSDICHAILRTHPQILSLNEKSLTFDEISKCSNLEEAKDFLISEEIEKMLFKPLSSFLDFFEKTMFKIEFPNLKMFRQEIIEIKERRNLLIHNGGVVNTKYINCVDKKLQEKYKIEVGKKIGLGKKYLEESIDKFELIGLEILFFGALKFQKGKEKEDAIWSINSLIYDTFVGKSTKFLLGESLSCFALSNDCKKYLNQQQQDYYQLNYWQILKKQNKLEQFNTETKKYDTSSKNNLIKLCYFSLIDDYTEACKYITPSLNEEGFDLDLYNEFPILSNLRKQKKAKEVIKKYKENK